MNSRAYFIFAFLFAFLTDQASKIYVVHFMGGPLRGNIPIIPPYLNFRYLENRGINFGLLRGDSDFNRWLLIILAILVVTGVAFVMRKRFWHIPSAIFFGLLVGGALGNIFDRLYQGFVTDFINNSLPNWVNPFSYNLADVWIFVGIFGLFLFEPKKDADAQTMTN